MMNPKMKAEEALFLFNNMEFAEKYQGKDEYTEMTLVIKQALEKQIPKKPTHEASLYKCLTCPNCKNVIDEFTEIIPKHLKVRVKTIHCKFCGQVLDWSDSE